MTKIDIFSGFLGAGKTTLIKKLIKEAFQGEKLVLIENEFGEIGIDGGFMKDAGINVTEMNSGCICCSLVGDFGAALEEVLEKYHPDRIIIEPSGVGKLSDVIKSVSGVMESHDDVQMNGYVTVADATKCKMYMKNFGEFYNNQVESAKTIVLSRTGKITDEKLDAALALIREKNDRATIITTPWDEIDGKQILGAIEESNSLELELMEEEDVCPECGHHHDHDHEHGSGEPSEEEPEYDEHVWLSLKNAQLFVSAIADSLSQADIAHADQFAVNAVAYNKQLAQLDAAYQSAVDAAPIKTVLFADRFPFRYLVDDYGLSYYAAFSGCSADTQASFDTIIFLADKVNELGLHSILTIENSDDKIANTIIQNTQSRDQQVRTLNSMQTVTSNDLASGTTYLSIMKENLSVLSAALQ